MKWEMEVRHRSSRMIHSANNKNVSLLPHGWKESSDVRSRANMRYVQAWEWLKYLGFFVCLFSMMMLKNILGPHNSSRSSGKTTSIVHEIKVSPEPRTLQLGKRLETLAILGFCEFSYRLSMHFQLWHKGQSVRQMSSPYCKVQGAKEQFT